MECCSSCGVTPGTVHLIIWSSAIIWNPLSEKYTNVSSTLGRSNSSHTNRAMLSDFKWISYWSDWSCLIDFIWEWKIKENLQIPNNHNSPFELLRMSRNQNLNDKRQSIVLILLSMLKLGVGTITIAKTLFESINYTYKRPNLEVKSWWPLWEFTIDQKLNA